MFTWYLIINISIWNWCAHHARAMINFPVVKLFNAVSAISLVLCLVVWHLIIQTHIFCFVSRLVKRKMLRKGWILQVLKTLRVLLLFYNLWFFLRKPCTEDGLTIHSSSYLFSCVTTLLWRKLGYKYSSWLWPFLYLGQ